MNKYNQNTLFGEKIISSIGYDEQEIINDILYLYGNGNDIDCDPTYSIGRFYKSIKEPKYKFDKYPQIEGVTEASSEDIPLSDNSCNVIMFDPPFVMSGQGCENEDCTGIISNRFTAFKNFKDLKIMYSRSLLEFYRIITNNGIVIFKCQDGIVSSKQYFTHCWVMQEAIKIGFYPRDLFVLVAKNRLNDGRKQQHARKYHSYFWVFQKTNIKVEY